MSFAASLGAHEQEIANAYPRLKREWKGLVVRLESTRRSGLSDFILIRDGKTTFTEVKALINDQYPLTVTGPQCEFLDKVNEAGGRGRLLVLCDGSWYTGAGPFLTTFMLGSRSLYDFAPTRLITVNAL